MLPQTRHLSILVSPSAQCFSLLLDYAIVPSPPLPPVFSPGEEARYWYAVVSGTVKMFNVDPDDSTKVRACSVPTLVHFDAQ